MLAKCANLPCSAEFRFLREGKLFQLEIDPTVRPSNAKATEYFWLCSRCSAAMTLRFGEEGTVVAVPLPLPIHGAVGDDACVSVSEKKKLSLRRVSFLRQSVARVA